MNESITQEHVWDKLAEPWSRYRKNPAIEIANFLATKKGRVLDLGCGSGRNFIANKNIQYYGVDFSGEMLKFAEKISKAEKINAIFLKELAEKLSFEDNFFDAAMFVSTLHCIIDEKNRGKALRELYRVLKKGAEALITVWDKETNKKFEKIPAKEGFVNWKKEGVNHQRYYYFYSREELEKLLKEIGFKILKIEKKDTKTLMGQHSKKNLIFYVQK
jgi:ubiquinone/menaquinone biosynthesis C-methylase UbiE